MKDLMLANSNLPSLSKLKRRRAERGMTTAEYAVGTIGVTTLGGILIAILRNEEFRALIFDVIKKLFEFIMSFFNGGIV
ncbi:MAG: DUF4244 domain-containing protein [Propionibacteriaceae bacterium]|jgi:hypothetical protein|nr:DUF4244 domain-containing protein [Propionibacteriaceae bacterium]